MRSSHGHTPAGWISVAGILVGSVIGAFGVGSGIVWLFVAGAAVVVLAALSAPVMQRAGLGQYPPRRSKSYANAQAYLGARREEDPPAAQLEGRREDPVDASADERDGDREVGAHT